MDVIYEESAVNQKATKDAKKYAVLNILSWIFIIVGIFFLMFTISNAMTAFMSMKPNAEISAEMIATAKGQARAAMFLFGFFAVDFIGLWVLFFLWKRRVNISFDYTFVSGELRIAKVFNINRRKFLYRIESEEIQQLGDVESESYERLSSSPDTKEYLLTPNYEPSDGKFFMYLMTASSTGKQLYILECREDLLVNLLKFVRRGTLASDYVMQEKKKAQTAKAGA